MFFFVYSKLVLLLGMFRVDLELESLLSEDIQTDQIVLLPPTPSLKRCLFFLLFLLPCGYYTTHK